VLELVGTTCTYELGTNVLNHLNGTKNRKIFTMGESSEVPVNVQLVMYVCIRDTDPAFMLVTSVLIVWFERQYE
jgi:hypothetical protein